MSVRLRRAEPADAASVRAIHVAAFPTCGEADLVETLDREGSTVISLLAEQDGRAVGHVLLSRMTVSGEGRAYRALGLAPVAVLPEAQGKGVGSALIAAALRQATLGGEELVFVLGDPVYYGRFGFSAECALPFASPYAGPHLMALRLREGARLPRSGRADYARAFADLEG